MLAISTAWNAARHSKAKDIIAEIKTLGFDTVELNFNLTETIVRDLLYLKRRGSIKVVSVHNFCPIPKGTSRQKASPDIFSLSSLDEDKRQKAVRYTKKTIDTAQDFKAKAVVLHLGKVEIKERIKELACAFNNKNKLKFNKLKVEMIRERKEKSKRFFSQALKSLGQLYLYAQKHRVRLGIENRFYFSEIPNVEEMEVILKIFPSSIVSYWHDVGHAQVYDYLKLNNHQEILRRFSKRMIGIHLHDIRGIDDHRAPLKGSFDFSLLKPFLKKRIIKVLEPHYPASAEEIIRGRQYLERLFKIRMLAK